jgi:hypothetical protein
MSRAAALLTTVCRSRSDDSTGAVQRRGPLRRPHLAGRYGTAAPAGTRWPAESPVPRWPEQFRGNDKPKVDSSRDATPVIRSRSMTTRCSTGCAPSNCSMLCDIQCVVARYPFNSPQRRGSGNRCRLKSDIARDRRERGGTPAFSSFSSCSFHPHPPGTQRMSCASLSANTRSGVMESPHSLRTGARRRREQRHRRVWHSTKDFIGSC